MTANLVKLPTVRASALESFQTLADLADRLVERHCEILQARRRLTKWIHDDAAPDDALPYEFDLLLDEDDRRTLNRARHLLDRLDSGDLYEPINDDDGSGGGLKRAAIGERLAMMASAFPNGRAAMPEDFAQMLLEHIVVARPTAVGLHSCCMQIESERATFPTIGVILAVLKQHEAIWNRRRHAISGLLACSDADVVAELTEARKKLAARTLQWAQRDLRHAEQALVARQADARAAGETVAVAFARLLQAEAEVDNAAHDLEAQRAGLLPPREEGEQ